LAEEQQGLHHDRTHRRHVAALLGLEHLLDQVYTPPHRHVYKTTGISHTFGEAQRTIRYSINKLWFEKEKGGEE
jgi:hypothetical protein